MLDQTVHQGRNGWLFLSGGSNNPYGMYSNRSHFKASFGPQWKALLLERERFCRSVNIPFLHLIAPEKLSVYPEFCMLDLPFLGYQPTGAHSPLADPELQHIVVNPVPDLLEAKQTVGVYPKLESHWNLAGTVVAHDQVCRRFGLDVKVDVAKLPTFRRSEKGDLGSKIVGSQQEVLEKSNFPRDCTRIYTNPVLDLFHEIAAAGGWPPHRVGIACEFLNTSDKVVDKKIMIFGDSFSDFRPGALTCLFANTFRSVHFVWQQSVDFDYVAQIRPDYLLTEGAERFMNLVPDNKLRFEASAQKLVDTYRGAKVEAR